MTCDEGQKNQAPRLRLRFARDSEHSARNDMTQSYQQALANPEPAQAQLRTARPRNRFQGRYASPRLERRRSPRHNPQAHGRAADRARIRRPDMPGALVRAECEEPRWRMP